jgi:uncharacterized protein (DUF486 family)
MKVGDIPGDIQTIGGGLDTNPCGLSVPWDVTSFDYLLQVDTNPCGLSVPWDVTNLSYLLQVNTNPFGN